MVGKEKGEGKKEKIGKRRVDGKEEGKEEEGRGEGKSDVREGDMER